MSMVSPGCQLRGLGGGGGDDGVGVGCDALAVEGGGGDAALTDVDWVVGGDEALAEEDLHALEGALADEGRGLIDEDFADVLGVVDEDDVGVEELVLGDVAEGLVEVLEEQDGAADADPGLEGVGGERVFEAGGDVVFGIRRWVGLSSRRWGVWSWRSGAIRTCLCCGPAM